MLLEESRLIYEEVAIQLGRVAADLTSFKVSIDHLVSGKDGRFDAWVKDIRMKVYIPVCIGSGGIGCSIAAAALEAEIANYRDSLDGLKASCAASKAAAQTVVDQVSSKLDYVKEELRLVRHWEVKVEDMLGMEFSSVDSMVEDIEFLGVGDLKTTLADLAGICQSYLDHKLKP